MSSNADPLFRKNKVFKLEDLVKLETSKLMFNFDRCKLPNFFTEYFKKVSQIHSRVNRYPTIICSSYQDTNPIACKDLLNIGELKFGIMYYIFKKKLLLFLQFWLYVQTLYLKFLFLNPLIF